MHSVNMLPGKTALVTGGGSGIGRGIALRLASEGAAVGVLDLNECSVRQVVNEVRGAGGTAIPLVADLSNAQAVERARCILVQTLGTPHILVHSAGIMPDGTIDQTTEEQWDRVFAVNVRGAYLACRQVVPMMRQAGGSSIILIASITGVNGFPGLAAYSATKGVLIALARAMAIDHAAEGIRVNAVSPGT